MISNNRFCTESIKLAYFDIDGTLSAPEYHTDDGGRVIGFSEEGWAAYCEREGERGYRHCKPVKPVKDFALGLKAAGTRLFVLSTSQLEQETAAKICFINDNYPDMFDEVITVENDMDKLAIIEKAAEKEGVLLSSCLLVDDTYRLLLKASERGIRAMHVSNIIAGNVF